MNELAESGLLLQMVVAFGGGVMSFVSPCVLPLLPGYLAMITGHSTADVAEGRVGTRRMVSTVGLFVLGFTIVFVAFGATATSLSQLITRNLPELTRLAGWVIVAFGLLIVAMAISNRGPLAALNRDRRFDVRPSRMGRLGPPVMGMAFAFGWTPCVGPILAVILAAASTQSSVGRGMTLLVAYSAGLGIPFLVAGLGMMNVFKRVRRWARPINIASGLALAAFGVVMITGAISDWSASISRLFFDVPFLSPLAEV